VYRWLVFFLLTAVLFTAGCSEERVPAPVAPVTQGELTAASDAEALAWAIVEQAGWPMDEEGAVAVGPEAQAHGAHFPINAMDREILTGDVAHYSIEIQTGCGAYDVIRLHRVVRESRPYRPIRTGKCVFLQHGDLIGFVKFIFGSETQYLPDDQSMATLLAMNDFDVWGIDQPWVLVPAGLPDYSFSADWGMQHAIDHLRSGLAIARFARLLTGSGFDKMNLLGYSSGGFTGYAYLNEESQMPRGLRHLKGFIAYDTCFKLDRADPRFETGRENCCLSGEYYASLLAGGTYDPGWGTLFPAIGHLAEAAPDDPSPYFPGLTNLQAALAAGATPDPTAWSPWYHYVAGVYDGVSPVPVGLRFTSTGAWLDFIQTAAPFEPLRFIVDYFSILCDEENVPFDDHLADITVPVLYLGAAGGFGECGAHTLDLLGSTDKTYISISLFPPEEVDFAHIDLITSDNTVTDVWPHVLEWLEAHSE
jgi:hypothetical protein